MNKSNYQIHEIQINTYGKKVVIKIQKIKQCKSAGIKW